MKKASIYTRGGDKGETSLVGGTRLNKANIKIDLYGEVDELNSFIGVAVSSLNEKYEDLKKKIFKVQSDLFNIGSILACEVDKREQFNLPIVKKEDVSFLENLIDEKNSKIEEIKYFILPGGCISAAHFHVARTVCRRVERKLISFKMENDSEVPPLFVEYFNRLSDLLFIFSRYLNTVENVEEIKWVPKID